jgi:uncharacterized pyridoxal phosphate-containing UPF0001 family protein
VAPEDTLALAQTVAALPGLCLRGIMTIPEPTHEAADTLAVHQRTKA